MYICACVSVFLCVNVPVYLWLCSCIYECVRTCVRVCAVSVCVQLFASGMIRTHTHARTNTQTHSHILHKHTHTHTWIHTHDTHSDIRGSNDLRANSRTIPQKVNSTMCFIARGHLVSFGVKRRLHVATTWHMQTVKAADTLKTREACLSSYPASR